MREGIESFLSHFFVGYESFASVGYLLPGT